LTHPVSAFVFHIAMQKMHAETECVKGPVIPNTDPEKAWATSGPQTFLFVEKP